MKRLGFLCLMVVMTGCTHLNNQFDCPPSKGVGCKRLSTINEDYNVKHGIKNIEPRRTTYVKSPHFDVYFEGYEDEVGSYHHPRKVTVKA